MWKYVRMYPNTISSPKYKLILNKETTSDKGVMLVKCYAVLPRDTLIYSYNIVCI